MEGSLSLLLASIASNHRAYGALVAAKNPLAWYRLNELSGTVAANSGQLDADGTYTGSVTLGAAGLVRRSGACINCSGTDAYVDIPTLTFNPTKTEFAFVAWARPTSVFVGDVFAQRDGSGTGRSWCAFFDNNDIIVNLGNSQTRIGSYNPGQTYMISYDKNGSNFDFYLNGQFVLSSAISVESCDGGMLIGTYKGLNTNFQGDIDEVALFGSTLGPDMHARLYAAGA